jgi:hypothetical protein
MDDTNNPPTTKIILVGNIKEEDLKSSPLSSNMTLYLCNDF